MLMLHSLTRKEDVGAAARVPSRLLEVVSELPAGDPSTGNI